LKIITWNVNGLRACLNKGFLDFFDSADADVFCVQETKMQPEQAQIPTPGYEQFFNSAVRKGYSGTACFSKPSVLRAAYGITMPEHDQEGRVITLEYESFILINLYAPNSQQELARLPYRMKWEDDFRTYILSCDVKKPVILCGDLNVAHTSIDLKNPKTNERNAGFTQEERDKLTELLASGFTDAFRELYPDVTGAYTWWSYRFNARKNNAGWRIDYFLVSQRIKDRIQDCVIHSDVYGSDHCPVELTIDF
jgi:exodeoxyribonuclease-3